MFHHTNFGTFGESLRQFADVNGYVPEFGDSLDKMAYPNPPVNWESFIEQAVQATQAAKEGLDNWREPKRPGRPRGGQYGAGGGAPKLSARIDEPEILDWIKSFPGGTAGVLRAAYANRKRLK